MFVVCSSRGVVGDACEDCPMTCHSCSQLMSDYFSDDRMPQHDRPPIRSELPGRSADSDTSREGGRESKQGARCRLSKEHKEQSTMKVN